MATTLYGTGNIVTESGSYILAPVVPVLGVIGVGPASATFTGGINATVDIQSSAISLLTAFTVTSTNGANVTVGSSSSGLAALLSGAVFNASGGTLTIGAATLSALSNTTYNVTSGGTLAISTNGSDAQIAALRTTNVDFGNGGGTLYFNTSGTNLSVITGFNINSFGVDDTIRVAGAGSIASAVQSGGNTIITTDNGVSLTLSGDYYDYAANHNLYQVASGGSLYISTTAANSSGSPGTLVCFLAGTRIRTTGGDVAVEDLRPGDLLVTLTDGRETSSPVIWTARQEVRVRAGCADDEAGYPVRIAAGALSEGVPARDLRVTPEHCLYLDGVFIPARMLVNGGSIAYDREATTYEIFHVETERHSIILAEAAPTESYLDTGNRRHFIQDRSLPRIGPVHHWQDDAAAPLATAREVVEPVHQRIARRSAAIGLALPSPAASGDAETTLHLLTADGRRLDPVRRVGGRIDFMIPARVQELFIVSGQHRPCDTIGPFVDDRRRLGVAIGDISFIDGQVRHALSAHRTDPTLDGWHAIEPAGARWTSGKAALPLPPRQKDSFGLLSLDIRASGPYPLVAASRDARPACTPAARRAAGG